MEQHEKEIAQQAALIKDRSARRWLKIIGAIFMLCLFGGGAAALSSYLTLRGAAEDGTQLAQQIKEQCDSPGATDPQLAQFCPKADEVVKDAPSIVKSDPVPGPPGPQGEQGDAGVGPSAAQILQAVQLYCTQTKTCEGTAGKDATPAQVAAAVSTYCSANGQCQGPRGEPGTDGANGANGADAPAITQSQIVAAVETYCGNNNCRGPAGSDGAQGETGVVAVVDNCDPAPAGQVIADVTPAYDAETKTVTISCTYKDDETGGLINLPGSEETP